MCFGASNLAETVQYGFILEICMCISASTLAETVHYVVILLICMCLVASYMAETIHNFVMLEIPRPTCAYMRLTWPKLFIMVAY